MLRKYILMGLCVGYMTPSTICADEAAQQKEINFEEVYRYQGEFDQEVENRRQILRESISPSLWDLAKESVARHVFAFCSMNLCLNVKTFKKEYVAGDGFSGKCYLYTLGTLVSSALLWSIHSDKKIERERLAGVEDKLVELQEKIESLRGLKSYKTLRSALKAKRFAEKSDSEKTNALMIALAALGGFGVLYGERIMAKQPKFTIGEKWCSVGLYSIGMGWALARLIGADLNVIQQRDFALENRISTELTFSYMQRNLQDTDMARDLWKSCSQGWQDIAERRAQNVDNQGTSIASVIGEFFKGTR